MYDLELGHWGDGTVRLSYWDHLHGRDRHYILDGDGHAYIEVEQSDGTETRQEIDLIKELRIMTLGETMAALTQEN